MFCADDGVAWQKAEGAARTGAAPYASDIEAPHDLCQTLVTLFRLLR